MDDYNDFHLSKDGLIWVKMPWLNVYSGSGVQFRGKYMTISDYKKWMKFKSEYEKRKKRCLIMSGDTVYTRMKR